MLDLRWHRMGARVRLRMHFPLNYADRDFKDKPVDVVEGQADKEIFDEQFVWHAKS